jgi:hypothetical protein
MTDSEYINLTARIPSLAALVDPWIATSLIKTVMFSVNLKRLPPFSNGYRHNRGEEGAITAIILASHALDIVKNKASTKSYPTSTNPITSHIWPDDKKPNFYKQIEIGYNIASNNGLPAWIAAKKLPEYYTYVTTDPYITGLRNMGTKGEDAWKIIINWPLPSQFGLSGESPNASLLFQSHKLLAGVTDYLISRYGVLIK